MKIIALVVTFNRRELLIKALEAIEKQTIKPTQIIVIDNNSSDGTDALMKARHPAIELKYERLNQNIGGAGGFKLGIQHAYELGSEWVWCMDDDCIPKTDALEKLISAQNSQNTDMGFLTSRVLWVDNSLCLMNLPVAHNEWIEPHERNPMMSRIIGSSFVSILISRKAIEAVGYPVKEFFIWFDDAEYTRRISAVLPAYLVTNSVVIHETPSNIKPLAFENIDRTNLWKYCYGVRNEMSFHLHSLGAANALLFILRIFRRMVRVRLKLRFWPYIIKALFDGLSFNYLKYIEYPKNEH